MKTTIKEFLKEKLQKALKKLKIQVLDESKLAVTFSNRPELADFQSNIAFVLAKELKTNPMELAGKIKDNLDVDEYFEVSVCAPAFINFKLHSNGVVKLANDIKINSNYGINPIGKGKTVVVDYGGANIAKELHMGHLRAPIIGEAIVRLHKLFGYKTVGDVHLGDWGLQMGLVMAVMEENGDLDYYFGKNNTKPEITLAFLNENYPKASARSKTDPDFKAKAENITLKLQAKTEPYYTIWKDIRKVSIEAIKRNYDNLNCTFDLWYGESDAEAYINKTVNTFVDLGLTKESEGATIVEVKKEGEHIPIPKKDPSDPNERQLYKNPMPPVILKKHNGGDLYATTDIATIMQRVKDNKNLDKIIYVVDKRQETHFIQVFRASKMAGIAPEKLELVHVPYGTMNGKDGKAFKTRSGDTIKLEDIINMVASKASEKLKLNGAEVNDKLALQIGVGAMKFGDLINEVYKDYVFDLDSFMSFEGKTGPYIQYTAVRIKSLLAKAGKFDDNISFIAKSDEGIIIEILKLIDSFKTALVNMSPSAVCNGVYNLASKFSTFYNNTRILSEEDNLKRNSYLSLSKLVLSYIEKGLDVLAISVPERM